MTIPFLDRSPAHRKVGYGGLGEKIQVTTDDGDREIAAEGGPILSHGRSLATTGGLLPLAACGATADQLTLADRLAPLAS
jgi:hypothetical protein